MSRTLQLSAVHAVASAQRRCIGEVATSSAAPMYVAAMGTIGAIAGTKPKERASALLFFLLTLKSFRTKLRQSYLDSRRNRVQTAS
ncbi:MAG: hypothetical protein JWR09_5791 [Mucilaginibacter sp.]|jgi:hypothetical protein|nr:hypothetical protein [Mucilaginibacter sp.]